MIVLAFASSTGGAGRSTLATACARQLATLGRQVKLIQADPANNLAYLLGHMQAAPQGLLQAVLGQAELQHTIAAVSPGLDVVHFGQGDEEALFQAEQRLKYNPGLLADLLGQTSWAANTVVIIDCPRAPSPWCTQVFSLSDLNLVLMAPEPNTMWGTDALLPGLLKSRGASYFLMNRFESSKVLHLDLWTLSKLKLSHRLLPFYLHEDQALAESIASGLALQEYAPQSQLVEDLAKLCNWIDGELP